MNATHSTERPAMAQEPDAHAHAEGGYRIYWRTWLWLLVITLLEVGAASTGLSRPLMIGVLVLLSVMKGALIMAYFMHLRFERLHFVYAVLSPLIFVLILLAGVAPDALGRLG